MDNGSGISFLIFLHGCLLVDINQMTPCSLRWPVHHFCIVCVGLGQLPWSSVSSVVLARVIFFKWLSDPVCYKYPFRFDLYEFYKLLISFQSFQHKSCLYILLGESYGCWSGVIISLDSINTVIFSIAIQIHSRLKLAPSR